MSTPGGGQQKTSKTIDRSRLQVLMSREEQDFIDAHPKSAALYSRAQKSLLGGVPMNWMKKWAGKFPVFVAEAHGAHFKDVDGSEYVDLCLGDTGAMTGHPPSAATAVIARMNFGAAVASGQVPGVSVDTSRWQGMDHAAIAKALLGHEPSKPTLDALATGLEGKNASPAVVASLVLGAPDFERR